ncbi:MAG TPA: LytTR family DNA-binding domain-containing protein [Thermoanaerobaculia bacterium]|nr:LytTR family DNA-binding domain-containing protein [Thermoanaerobaculia bacterium]
MIRTLIVDDEPLARARVTMLLASHDDVEIIGEAGDGASARTAIANERPDLVLLDIQMPGGNGVKLAESLPEPRPVIVFLTAYDSHAVEAFDAAALDYVLKPIDPKRLALALDRVRRQLAQGIQSAAEFPDRFLVRKSRGRRVVVRAADIEWIGAERNYVRLHTPAGSHLMRDAIGRLEEQLDPAQFARIHRSAIVSLEYVSELDTDADGSLYVTLRSGQRLSVGDSYRDLFQRRLGRAL